MQDRIRKTSQNHTSAPKSNPFQTRGFGIDPPKKSATPATDIDFDAQYEYAKSNALDLTNVPVFPPSTANIQPKLAIGSLSSSEPANTSESVIQRGLWDSFKKGLKKIGGAIASEEKSPDPEPLSLTQSLNPSSISDDEIKQEIKLIRKWIAKHQESSPDATLLASCLQTFESEVEAREAVAAVKKLPGWGKMASNDQAILENMLKGRENDVSKSVRSRLKALKTVLSSQTDIEQGKTLTGLINAKESIPGVVSEPVSTTKIKYTLAGPTTEKDYAFQGKKADAEKWIVKFEDGINIPIVAPKAPEPGHHNHTVKQAADAASYLPKANRSVMTTILLNAVVNPDDAYWATEYNTPDFHSYMTAGKSGVVTIYPDKVSEKLPDENYMRGTMIHETGHTWSYKNWGTDTKKGKWVDWQQAMDKDKVSVSGYAMNSIDEDVAETIQIYVSTKGSPRFAEYLQIVPNRFKMLDVEYK
ncbi:hypothetical protein [Anabaena sp. UHCC 0204]|uniref:hypothetical protein n=1 Tax=Anabaena sp. UHCC 0204 TaxID=2590009 RepID=UPI0014477163|nr:hypothetical protein [Anabaena sp. UHCC 0204]MTJ07873.1 hypothetical protein [Anabaena sp. UHCC 0204]